MSDTETSQFAELPKLDLLLVGHDGNGMALIASARRAALQAGWTMDQVEALLAEMMDGDYNHLVKTLMGVCKDKGL